MAVIERTYQASDLAGTGRREFLDEARAGHARLRDTDGVSLVMLPERDHAFLESLRVLTADFLALTGALNRDREDRQPTDFGGLAWADSLPDEDLNELRREFGRELARATASGSLDSVSRCMHEWQMAASTLSDPVALEILEGRVADDQFVDLGRPTSDA